MTISWGADVLSGTKVIELSSGLAGAFCAKSLADAGADVIKVEDPLGDGMRRRCRVDTESPPAEDGALFRFLNQSKRSVVIDTAAVADCRALEGLLSESDVIIWSPGSQVAQADSQRPARLAERYRESVVCAITPFGLNSSWTGRPASDLVIQAWAGAVGHRGGISGPPVAVGGEMSEWACGVFATVAVLTSLYRARTSGGGELLDVSLLESAATSGALAHPVTFASVAGRPLRDGRIFNLPGIYRAKDGWVGFMVITGQQWHDFCVLVDHPEWIEDSTLLYVEHRLNRFDELHSAIAGRLSTRTVDEVLELAEVLRVPAAPIGDGSSTPDFPQSRAAGMFESAPDASFVQPVPWYRIPAAPPRRRPRPAPELGSHREAASDWKRQSPDRANVHAGGLPLAGLRVADLTAFWAGPTAGRYMASMGADVIRVESPKRMDGFRSTIRPDDERWWEWSPMVAAINVGKRHLGLDLSSPKGRDVLLTLIDKCDVLIENFTPRVLENWRIDHEILVARNPSLLVVRMPAYGLSGPWRDRPGYAQTIEMASGLAWTTGFPEGPPVLPNGQVDPLGGNLTLIGLLLALEHRRRGGSGGLVEVPLFASALAISAEPVVEYSARGHVIGRNGNRHATFAPQGVYACGGSDGREGWVAISVTSDDAWYAFRAVLGNPPWAMSPLLEQSHSRIAAHDMIDQHLAQWCAERASDDIVAVLWANGVAVAKVLMPHEQMQAEPLADGRFYEELDHPVLGPAPYQTFPVRFSRMAPPFIRRRSPLFGEHNLEILTEVAGLELSAIRELEQLGIVSQRPMS
jgi:crotonobetainyl-CoA:carnitine CoA-transferase CaiB-like acyl-CoA transferase